MRRSETLLDSLGLTSRQLFRQFQHMGGVGNWVHVCGSGECWWSDELYRMYGVKKETPVSCALMISKALDEDRRAAANAYRGLQRRRAFSVVHRALVGGRVRWFEQKGRLFGTLGTPGAYIIGSVRDITVLKAQQEHAHAQELDFAAINTHLSETTNTNDLYSIVASAKRTVRRRLDVAMVAIFVQQEHHIERIIPKGTANPEVFLFQEEENYVAFDAIQTGRQCVCPVGEYRDAACKEALMQLGTRCVISFPIKERRKTVGALSLALRVESLSRREETFCRTLCGYLSSQLSGSVLHRRLERELADRQRLESDLDIIFSESIDCICMLDLRGRFSRINPNFSEKLGISPLMASPDALFASDRRGISPLAASSHSLLSFVHPHDRDYVRYMLASLPDTGVARAVRMRILYTDGQTGYWEFNLKYSAATGMAVAVGRDITHLHRTEARNLELEKKIALEQVKSEFLANFSHEFKTPLNIILSSLDLMKMKIARADRAYFAAEYEKFFQYAYRNSYRLLRLTTNLLDLTKIEGQHLKPHFCPCDLADLLADVVESASGYAAQRGITLAFRPEGDTRASVHCDPEKIDRVVLNLLSNAIKHTPAQGVIAVALRLESDAAWITVTDSGSGLSPEILPHLFEKFHTHSGGLIAGEEGNGLGLFLSRALIEMHGGSITAANRPEGGAVFCFSLSRALAPEALSPDSLTALPYLRSANQTLAKLELSHLG